MEKVNEAMGRLKSFVGMEVEEEVAEENVSFFDDFNRQCTLSTKQRMTGFAICLVAGLTCTLMSILVFFNPIKFAVAFTLGNMLSLGSTAFLIGPKRQVHSKLLTLLAIIIEFCALFWYSLSYIPFARAAVSKAMLACFDTEF
ncbi:vesicle transport protein SFT2B isoform X2 [Amborella trichopoda]|uniref:vesicle transport protein SFT2B isoform X2 n=1 Tax=Amborella trichopoda TaxID=13333 RepID=UPI0005D2EBA9|nr:vesicle transport protein SFT2B isoform X2 [Amborella trichopoda]|eukprot:XP_011621014.1 vesicle transport protein SFT2B isoform X2 [Amborella trichopoda]